MANYLSQDGLSTFWGVSKQYLESSNNPLNNIPPHTTVNFKKQLTDFVIMSYHGAINKAEGTYTSLSWVWNFDIHLAVGSDITNNYPLESSGTIKLSKYMASRLIAVTNNFTKIYNNGSFLPNGTIIGLGDALILKSGYSLDSASNSDYVTGYAYAKITSSDANYCYVKVGIGTGSHWNITANIDQRVFASISIPTVDNSLKNDYMSTASLRETVGANYADKCVNISHATFKYLSNQTNLMLDVCGELNMAGNVPESIIWYEINTAGLDPTFVTALKRRFGANKKVILDSKPLLFYNSRWAFPSNESHLVLYYDGPNNKIIVKSEPVSYLVASNYRDLLYNIHFNVIL